MTVVSAATDASSERFLGIHKETALDALLTRDAALVSEDRGYLEVFKPAQADGAVEIPIMDELASFTQLDVVVSEL